MFSSAIDYRWRIRRFPQGLNKTFSFQPFKLFCHSFQEILIQFLYLLGFCSISGFLFIPRILHWQMAQLKRLNKGMLMLCGLELPVLPYVVSITAISWFPEYRLYYVHEIIWWPCGKMICHSQSMQKITGLCRREALWLYAIILSSSIECWTLSSPNVINPWIRILTLISW